MLDQFIALTGADNSPRGYAVFAGTFLGIMLFVTGLIQLLWRGETYDEAHNRRLRMIAEGKKTPELLALLKPGEEGRGFRGLPFLATLPRDLTQAGILVRPRRFVWFCASASGAVALIAMGFMPMLQAAVLGPIVGFGFPIMVVRQRRRKRLEKLVSQLPDALDLMSRGLSVGHPLNTSIGSVANEMPDPLGTEFGIIYDQISYGDDLTDAVQDFAERVDLEDAYYLAASIGIQHGTGGDLARVTRLLSETVRNRIAMRRRIKAISSEGRMTGQFLSILPVGIFAFSMLTTPDHFGGVMDDPLFPIFAGVVIGFTVINYLILRHLVNFRI